MGFFDREVITGFDELFDFNHDGIMDDYEQLREYHYLDDMSREMEQQEQPDFDFGFGDVNGCDDFDSDLDEDSTLDEIQSEIEFMDLDEAIDYIESNGYDIDDFDF